MFIGKKLGKVENLDLGQEGDCLGKYTRFRVEIDVSKLLERGFDVAFEGEDTVIVMIKYECLST